MIRADQVRAFGQTARGRQRRARVEECASLTAEHAYFVLLRDARSKLHPGAIGELRWIVEGGAHRVAWEIRANRLWRGGRVFFNCGVCHRRATRIYMPTPEAPTPACRSCWHLSYESQQTNYRDTGVLKEVGLTSRALAKQQTWLKRRYARAAARARRAARRPFWTSH